MRLSPPEPLTASHRLDDFECGEAALDDWLKRRALANQSSGASRTFVVTDQDGRVRGYYAMAAGAVSHQLATSGVRRNMPDPVPVMVLARLAVDRRMGAATWVAHGSCEYGRMLAAAGEHERARPLLAEATRLATAAGMAALLSRIPALGPVAAQERPDGLSPRELDVLRLVAQGRSNRDIGAELFISEHTAANHVRSILRKTSSANRTEAAGYAHRCGLAGSGQEA